MAAAEAVAVEVSQNVQGVLESVKGLNDDEKATLILKVVEGMNVLGLNNLVKLLERVFGVTAAAPVAMAAGPAAGGAGAAAAAAEEQTSFDVILKAVGEKKINVIKAVRAITNLGLKEAKDLVEKAPTPVKEGVSKDEAAKIKTELEKEGATVELK